MVAESTTVRQASTRASLAAQETQLTLQSWPKRRPPHPRTLPSTHARPPRDRRGPKKKGHPGRHVGRSELCAADQVGQCAGQTRRWLVYFVSLDNGVVHYGCRDER